MFASGIFHASKDNWKDIRRFTLAAMRDLGVGKKTIEGRIQEEVSAVQAEILSRDGKAFAPQDLMSLAVSNIICSVCFGDR